MNPLQFFKDKLGNIRFFKKSDPVADGADDDADEDDEDKPGISGFFKLLLVLLFLAVVAAGAFSAKPVYHWVVAWRAHTLAVKAMDQVEKKDWEGAGLTIRAAYQLAPGNEEVIRAVATVLTRNGDPQSLGFWKQVVEFPDATMDDRRQFVELALQSGNTISPIVAKVDEQLRYLLDKEPDSARLWLLAGRLNTFYGAPERILLCARRAHELAPRMDDATLSLASLLLNSPDSQQEGMDLLWTLIDGNGKNSLSAALLASQFPNLSADRTESLIRRLKTDPGAKESHRLQALDLEIRAHPENRAALLDAAGQSAASLDQDSLAELGAWFNAHGWPERALAVVPGDLAKQKRSLLLVYLDALAALKRWKVIDETISGKATPLEPFVAELFKARCDMELGKQDEAADHWRAAQTAATGNPEQSFYVAKYLRQFGRTGQAVNIYRSFLQNSRTARAAYLELLQIAAPDGTAAVHAIIGEMHARWPQDEQIQNDHAYFSLLLGKDIRESLAAAEKLVKTSPGSMAHRTTLALAFLRSGSPTSALAVYDGLAIHWESQPTAYRVVRAAVLRANGRSSEAVLSTLRPDTLSPEERALIGL